MKVTRRFRFSACHYLFNASWTVEKNREVFGKSINRHGHNFEVFVTVEGEVDPETGMVINLEELKAKVSPVIETLDHRCLNDLEYFRENLPTLENIARYIFREVTKKLRNVTSVLVKTGENEFAECTKNDVLSGLTHHVSASHRLPEDYGKCGEEKHGHDYQITVWLKGKVDVKRIRGVLSKLDHRDLNEILPFPSGEHLALYIAEVLGKKFQVKKICIHETENNSFLLEL